MRAARFHQFGGPEVLRIEEVETPRPGPDEVLVAVRASAFNHLDLWVRRGLPIQTTMPHIGGSDVAGVVAEVGGLVEGLAVGTRVVANPGLSCGRCRDCVRGEESLCQKFTILGEHSDGGFAEYVVIPARNLQPIPDSISFEEAACLPVSYGTAWRAVVSRGRVVPGEEIAAIQIAALAGATVHAVTSGPDKVERVRALGATYVHDRLEVNFSRAVHYDTDRRGADLVIDSVGSPTWEGSLRALASAGRLVIYGATAGPNVSLDLRRLFWRQFEIIGTTMASRAEFEAMLRAAWAGKLSPVIDRVLSLDEVRTGHEILEAGQQFGKIVVTIPEGS
jgi:NADPH:quinone reductase-like Zn-dependent oxidoreductase